MNNNKTALELITLAEAASILQISKRTLLRMIQQGEVPAFKVGGQWRIRESQFRKWVEEREDSGSVQDGTRQMADQIRASHELLEKRVLEKTSDLDSLYAVLTPLTDVESGRDIWESAIERLINATGADAGLIRILDKATASFLCLAQVGFPSEYLEATRHLQEHSAIGVTFLTGQPIIASDIAVDPRLKGKTQLASGFASCALLPLRVAGELRGIIHLASREIGHFNEGKSDHLMAIARQMSVAMENRELFEESKKRAQEQEALNSIAEATHRSLDVKEVLEVAVDKILEVTRRERVYIRLKDPSTGAVTLAAHRRLSETYISTLLYNRTPGGKTDQVLESGNSIIVNDLEGSSLKEAALRESNRSIAWVALKARGKVVGVLNVSTAAPIPFSTREIKLLEAIGSILGAAVENARLYEASKDQLQRLETLHDLQLAMTSTLDLHETLGIFLKDIDAFFPEFGTIVTLMDPDSHSVRPFITQNISEEYRQTITPAAGSGLLKAVLDCGGPLIIRDVQRDPRVQHREAIAREGLASFLGVPLQAKEKTLGMLSVFSKREHAFSQNEVEFLSTIAGQAAMAIYNTQLYEQSVNLATSLSSANVTLQRKEETQKLLKELSQDIIALNLEDLLRKLTDNAARIFKVDVADIRILDNGVWRLLSVSGAEADRLKTESSGKSRGRSSWIVTNRKPLLIPDIQTVVGLPTGETRKRLGLRGYLGVPLFSRAGEVMGVLALLTFQPRNFTAEEVDLLEQLATDAGLALENARLYDEIQSRASKLESLNGLARLMTSSRNIEEVFNFLVISVGELFGATMARLWVENPDNGRFVCRATWGIGQEAVEWRDRVLTVPSESLLRRIVETKAPTFIPNVQEEPTFFNQDLARRLGFRSLAGIPVAMGDRVFGVLLIMTTSPREFKEDEKGLLKLFADHAAVAIENARLYEASQRNLQRLQVLHELESAMTSTLELQDTLEVLIEKIARFLPGFGAAVMLVDPATGQTGSFISRNLSQDYLLKVREGKGRGLLKAVLDHRTALVIPDVRIDPRVEDREAIVREGLVSFLGVPLTAKEKTLGILSVFTKTAHIFSQNEVEFLSTVTGQAAIAIQNAQLYTQMAELAGELAKSNTAKSEFLSVISHELRTPLMTVRGYTGLLEDKLLGSLNAEQEKALKKISNQSHELLTLINNVLQATHLEADTVTVERAPTDVSLLLHELKATLDFRNEKAVILTWDYPQDLPTIQTDPDKLKHILSNLINNALKFTAEGRVVVSARYLPHAGIINFAVADTGVGIPEHVIPSIFDIFRLVDSSETRTHGGVGLGLYIVKKYTELLGGKVAVKSKISLGSTFTVTLPLENGSAECPPPTRELPAKRADNGKTKPAPIGTSS